MSGGNTYFGDPENSKDSQDEEFEEMMRRWGIELPDEVKKLEPHPLLEVLLTEWCRDKYKRPGNAVKALEEGKNHREAAAVLFGYCYAFLTPFDQSVENRLESEQQTCLKARKNLDRANGGKTAPLIEEIEEDVRTLSDLANFRDTFHIGSILYSDSPDSHSAKSFVDVMLGATQTILALSGNKQYDPDVDELLSGIYPIIKEGRVEEAEGFTENKYTDDGQSISGDVVGFLACLACAVVCNSYAHIVSELRPANERDYLSAFIAYVKGFTYIHKMGRYYVHELSMPLADMEIKKAVNAWEQVKTHPSSVQNWQELDYHLQELSDVVMTEDPDEYGPDGVVAVEYFSSQRGFCRGMISQEGRQKWSLTEQGVLDLIRRGESEEVEFKESARWSIQEEAVKDYVKMEVVRAVAGFLNAKGGKVIIGVSDNGEVVGIGRDYNSLGKHDGERDKFENFLTNALCKYIGKVEFTQSVSFEILSIQGRDVCVIDVKRGCRPVYIEGEKGHLCFYVRVQNSTRNLDVQETAEYVSRMFPKGERES